MICYNQNRHNYKLSEETKLKLSNSSRIATNNVLDLKYGKIEEHTYNCIKCENKVKIKHRANIIINVEKVFCSRKCANSRIQTEEINKKRSITLTKLTKPLVIKECKYCKTIFETKNKHKIFCSRSCVMKHYVSTERGKERYRQMGLHLSKIRAKRSKNEIMFANLCGWYFNNVECNKQIFNGWDADVIIHDLKIAVLWNGAWHYKQCNKKHSVKQVQNRDKIKIKEIIAKGYTPYVIKDLEKANVNKVINEFNIFINLQK